LGVLFAVLTGNVLADVTGLKTYGALIWLGCLDACILTILLLLAWFMLHLLLQHPVE
jgi:hypothetical protein